MGAKTIEARYRQRKLAIRLLYRGWKTRRVADRLEVTKATVNRWWRLWQARGEEGLVETKRGPAKGWR